jgi:heptosyltransferase-2
VSTDPAVLLVVAPNWIGDAVMALPAMADLRRRYPAARLLAAARSGVADLLRLAPVVDEVVPLQWRGSIWARQLLGEDAARLRATGADVAVLLPNSFASAYLVSQAAIPGRWGYLSDLRRRLLTRGVPRPKGRMHQGQYYQHLTQALGAEPGPLEPELVVPEAAMQDARALLADRGWDGRTPFVALAPGAAYGRAKQWIPSHVVQLVTSLVRDRQTTCVLLGGRGDAEVTGSIRAAVAAPLQARVIDLAGVTSVAQLAAVLAASQACVTNDSGAMHVAAAVGAPVVALFGPTIVEATRPLTRRGGRAEVLTQKVWCRPCMLRECPLDHRCMTRITPERVLGTLEAMQ